MDVNIGKGITLPIDFTRLGFPVEPERDSVQGHIGYIGIRNILMDCHASVTKESNPHDWHEVAKALALKKLDALYAGELRIAGEKSTRETDPIMVEAKRLAASYLRDKLGSGWRKGKIDSNAKGNYAALASAIPSNPGESAENHLARIWEIIAKSQKFQADARENVEKRKGLTLDLGALGL